MDKKTIYTILGTVAVLAILGFIAIGIFFDVILSQIGL